MSKELITIRDVLYNLPVLNLGRKDNVKAALRLMEWNQTRAIGVMDDGIFSGIFTSGELFRNVIRKGLNPRQTILADVMTCDPITIRPECSLLEGFFTMCIRNVSHLPVLDNGKFLGIVSDDDLRLKISNDLRQVKKGRRLRLSYGGGNIRSIALPKEVDPA
jgi:CBS domain-containing protein